MGDWRGADVDVERILDDTTLLDNAKAVARRLSGTTTHIRHAKHKRSVPWSQTPNASTERTRKQRRAAFRQRKGM